MGLHPDDPPVPELKGIRVFSPRGGVSEGEASCRESRLGHHVLSGDVPLHGGEIEELIPEFRNDIVFAHMRDVEPFEGGFRETFHDNGPTDMPEILRLYRENGIDCLIRPDHAPTMAGEDNSSPGYAIWGRLLGASYLKGILDALGMTH